MSGWNVHTEWPRILRGVNVWKEDGVSSAPVLVLDRTAFFPCNRFGD